jgi:hypothetical protein
MDKEIEVMRIIRIPPRGQLVVQVGEQRFEGINEIHDEALGRFLLAAIGELVVFANGYSTLVAAGVAPPLARGSARGNISPAGTYSGSVEERQAAFIASLEAQRDLELVAAIPQKVKKASPAVEETEPLSIVDEINPLLQKQIDAIPELKGQAIFLESQPDGGLIIRVNGRLYDRPENIEDKQVRKAIAAALREWDET